MGYTVGLYFPRLAGVSWNPLAHVVQDLAVFVASHLGIKQHSVVKTFEQEHVSDSMHPEVRRVVANLQVLSCLSLMLGQIMA